MTLDRDVRLTPMQIHHLDTLARKRINALGKSIATATANRRAGVRIQERTLERHMDELQELALARAAFETARAQIQHQIRAKINAGKEEA